MPALNRYEKATRSSFGGLIDSEEALLILFV
jgi:hypothetical protein